MRASRKLGLLAAVFGWGAMALSAPSASAETLADAIALAYASNPQILTQRSSLRNVDESYYRTDRAFGPTISATIDIAGNTDNDLDDGFKGSSGASVTSSLNLNQTLYAGGRLTANLADSTASLQAARQNLRQVEMQVMSSVVAAYTAVRRAEASLNISTENVAVLAKQREEAQAKFEVGSSTRTDVAQADSRLATARSNLQSSQNTLDNARAQYRTVVGRSPEKLADEPSLDRLLPASQAVAFSIAEQNNPALLAAYQNERSSAARIAAAKAARRPSVTVTTGLSASQNNPAGFSPFSNGFGDLQSGLTTRGTLSIPLYTGLLTSSNIRTAEESNRSSNIAIESQRRSVNQTVTTAWNALVSARATIVSQAEAVRASTLAYEGTREEQQVGLRTTLDLLNAEQELRQAQLSQINAQFSLYTAEVDLLAAMGQLTPEAFGAQVEKYDPKKHFEEVNTFSLPWEPLVKTLDKIGAPAIPERQPLPGENVPKFEPLR